MHTANQFGKRFALFLLAALLIVAFAADTFAQRSARKRSSNPAFAPVTDKPGLPRVLLIGDSISIGYTPAVQEALEDVANVHRAPTNCGPTIRGLQQIEQWLGDGDWDVIHFNWGLHDLKLIGGKHQVPLDEYAENLQKLVDRLQETGATLIWCSTTPVPEGKVSPPRSDADVVAYNKAAETIMKEEGIAINDLYSFAKPKLSEIQQPVNVHFTPEGSKVLAEKVAESIRKVLEK